MNAGTLHLRDDEFLDAFETCSLPPESFRHADHIRLAWIYVRQLGPAAGSDAMAETIRRYALHHGDAGKYHETITRAWMTLVSAAVGAIGGANSDAAKNNRDRACAAFAEFAAAHPQLFDKNQLAVYYSKALLASEEARSGRVPPDRVSLPELSDRG